MALPVYRLLDPQITGLAGSATIQITDLVRGLLISGSILLLIPAFLAARYLSPDVMDRWVAAVARHLRRPGTTTFAACLAVLSAGLTAAFSLLVLHGKPNLIDAMVQLVEGRYLAHGHLAGPGGPLAAFWFIQNTVVTPRAWVAQYPPGHALLLAVGFLVHAVWAVGPALAGIATFFTALVLERLLPGRLALARLAALLVALCPFSLFLAGAYMNHVTAAACAAAAIYAALRARDGHWAWGIVAGACGGFLFITRPLSAISIGALPVLFIWLSAARRSGRWRLARLAAALLGAIPFGLAMAAWNLHFFGDPFRFGYIAAAGPAHQLGFHLDPWGNVYGPLQALAYTSADLTTLSLYLLETPLPVVALVGVYLLVARRLDEGEALIALWALAPVAANLFYWHHGQFMGPRMLAEAAPPWVALATVAGVGLVRMLPAERRIARLIWPRSALAGGLAVAAAVGLLVMAPQRAVSYGGAWMKSTRVPPPRPPGSSIVFVHVGWTERLGSRLAAHGMRLDSIESALRQNATCDVEDYLDSLESGGTPPRLDFTPRADRLPREVSIVKGDKVRVARGAAVGAECRAEMWADRLGIFPLAPLLWQGELPPAPEGGTLFVRDLGPVRDAHLLAHYPGRTPYVFMSSAPTATPRLEPYATAMQRLWGVPGEGEEGRP